MTDSDSLDRMRTSQHIGAAGELLVQYRLLKLAIDSARLTTDSGVDLVAYTPGTTVAQTIQVKTNAVMKPAGGKGAPTIGVAFPEPLRADFLAIVLLDADLVWILTQSEASELAQQRRPDGTRHLYWYGAPRTVRPGRAAALSSDDMDQFLLERRAEALFIEASSRI